MKSFRFPQPNGDVMVVTQRADDPTRFTSRMEGTGATVSDMIMAAHQSGAIKSK